ncbi:MAG: 3-isopropylmalate dehydratase large subunit [archaeon]|nr:3-isopropylmalate dehydratase large subunit [archaeon]MCP8306302.1 3-isopropylmalate dehydratase large subunit [archaeon]
MQYVSTIDKDFQDKILADQGLTFAEKILSIKRCDESGKVASTDDMIVAQVDLAMAHDGTAPLAIKVLGELGIEKVWDSNKVILHIDHTYPASSEQIADFHSIMRKFAMEQGCHIQEGNICHQYMLEHFVVPGMLIIGADSHTTTQGSLGAFATGVGSTEIAAVFASGRIWLKVPKSIKIIFNGKLPRGVFAKDLILYIAGKISCEGANYKAIEFTGSTVKDFTISSRATLCNMSTEVGAKAGIVEMDKVTEEYLMQMGRKPMLGVHSGKEAVYAKIVEEDVEKMEPYVALPYNVDNVKAVRDVEGQPIDQAFLGSCTNARFEDLKIAAEILKGRKVKEGVRLIVTPASKLVYKAALESGVIETLLQAGASITSPTCGACVGTHCGVLGCGEVCISCSNRNFIGRMGSPESKVYLASPATVAASAIKGAITDPRDYLR